jgi:hypothetical protein
MQFINDLNKLAYKAGENVFSYSLLNQLSCEQKRNLVEEFDDDVEIQIKFIENRLFEELARDLEDQITCL